MILKIKHTVSFLFLLSFIPFSMATGPSWIHAEIIPISINHNGDILCRTRFEKNPMGAYDFMEVEYGLGIIENNQLTQYITHTLPYPEDSDYDSYQKQRDYYEQRIQQCNVDNMSLKEQALREQYQFNDCNVAPYKTDTVISYTEFERQRNIDLSQVTLLGLKGSKGEFEIFGDPDKTYLHVLYDFGNMLILDNDSSDMDNINGIIGALFDYKSGMILLLNDFDEEIEGDLGFDIQRVTGIFFLNETE